MRKYLTMLALACAANAAMATNSFNPTNNQLSLDSVVLNGVVYTNVVVTVNSFTVNSVGNSAPVTVAQTCTSANLTVANYNAIALGMTLNQVNQTIGCANSPGATATIGNSYTSYGWINVSLTGGVSTTIGVAFDITGTVVTVVPGTDNFFKSRTGF